MTRRPYAISSPKTRNHSRDSRESRYKPTGSNCRGYAHSSPSTSSQCERTWYKTGLVRGSHPHCTTYTPSNPRMKLSHHTSSTKILGNIGGRSTSRSKGRTRTTIPSRPGSSSRRDKIPSNTCSKWHSEPRSVRHLRANTVLQDNVVSSEQHRSARAVRRMQSKQRLPAPSSHWQQSSVVKFNERL